MKKWTLLTSILVVGFFIANTQSFYQKFEIVDATDANQLYQSSNGPGWEENRGWPMPTGIIISYQTPYGVTFVRGDTIIYTYPPPERDTGIIKLHIKELDLSSNNLQGTIPAFLFDSLVLFDLGGNNISEIADFNAPKLTHFKLWSNHRLSSLPEMNFPSLIHLGAGYCNIQGELIKWETPSIEYISLIGNKITSVSADFAYANLKHLDLTENVIEGQLAGWDTPMLEKLYLRGNQLTSISAQLAYPNLTDFNIADNQILQELPNWDFPNLKFFYAYSNQFNGPLPAFNWPLIEAFDLNWNDVSGIIHDFVWPNVVLFSARGNQLSGELPNITAPNLITYDLTENKITGDLKNLDFPNLQDLALNYNQLDGTIQTSFDFPKLSRIQLDGNKLKGSIPSFSLPEIREIDMRFNQLTGIFPYDDMPELRRIHIEGNSFDSLPNLMNTSPMIWDLACWSNKLHFDDVLPYKDIERLEAYFMQPVPMYAIPIVDSILLTVHVKGNGNIYNWIFAGDTVKSGTDSLFIFGSQDPANFQCRITNLLLPNMRIFSELAEPTLPQCWGNGVFKICITTPEAGWTKGDSTNEIKSTQPLLINDLLTFEGSFALDTVDLEVKLNGKIYLKDIPLPGGAGIGNFKLAEGEYKLSIAGQDGKLTGFINDALSSFVPEIGGLQIKLDNLQLVGGLQASGVSLSFTISFDNITPSCGTGLEQETDIAITGLIIQKDGSIDVNGLQVNDLGFAPGFCLKELKASYIKPQDKLIFGLTILTPFIEVGGGLGFVGGQLDSIAMRAVLQENIIPLGNTGFGIIGCEGRISNIATPSWNIKFGGVLSSVVSDDLFQLTASLEYKPPLEIILAAEDGKFIRNPLNDDIWYIEGGVFGSLDLKKYQVKVGGNIKLLPYEDELQKKWIASGTTQLAFQKANPFSMVGKFQGMMTLPALSKSFPFDWLNAKIGLPYTVGGDGVLVYKPTRKFMVGTVDLGGRIGSLVYRVELGLPNDHPDYFTLIVKEADVSRFKSTDYLFEVPSNTKMAILKAAQETSLPQVTLLTPDGNMISKASPGDAAELDEDTGSHKAFWTLFAPTPGIWTATSEEEAEIEVYLITDERIFEIDVHESGGDLVVTWDPSLFIAGDTIELYADNDAVDFDGTLLMTADALSGTVVIPSVTFENECTFFVHAFGYSELSILSAYSDEAFENKESSFGPPTEIVVDFNRQSLVLEANWTPSEHANIAGYVIELVSADTSEIIAMPYSDEGNLIYQLPEFNNQQVVFYAYGLEGEVSCSSDTFDLITTGINDHFFTGWEKSIIAYPNPFSNFCTIRITSDKNAQTNLQVFNSMGVMMYNAGDLSIVEGVNEVYLPLSNLTPGTYYIVLFDAHKRVAKTVMAIR